MTENTQSVAGVPATGSHLVFDDLKAAVTQQFKRMMAHGLFRTDISGDELWDAYIASFPDGTNPIHRKRARHDCGCCRNFVRTIGNVVAVSGDMVTSLWDVDHAARLHPAYRIVATALSTLVKSRPIDNRFLHYEAKVGTDTNHELVDGIAKTWGHFFVELPRVNDRKIVCDKAEIGPVLSEERARHDVLLRALQGLPATVDADGRPVPAQPALSAEACETVLDLIERNALYRGEEHRAAVAAFHSLKRWFDGLAESQRDIFVWQKAGFSHVGVTKIRNTSIGSLLLDLSEGRDLEEAVGAFERMVAPQNYKRPMALVTQAMVNRARETMESLGLTSALERRFATLADVSVNNVLFADRSARKLMKGGAFDGIASAPAKPLNVATVQEVTVETFLTDILPGAAGLEIMLENRHGGNFVSLVAPADPSARSMFLWDNRFSWSYAGDVTDSAKERVKKAGGNVVGDLCCRLSWSNFDDLDLHMDEPNGYHIYYGNKQVLSPSGGMLDVDMNAGGPHTREPVENIFYASKDRMREGVYRLYVHQYSKRETANIGFEAQIDFQGDVRSYGYAKPMRDGEHVAIAEFRYTQKGGIEFIASLSPTTVSRKIWGVDTQMFHKVNVVLLSPNHWDGRGVGNRHYFFMLDECHNDGSARGFYNEFLKSDLAGHRKVLEILGAKMRAEESPDQLSGVGFSSTQRNQVVARVTGATNRTVRVTF